MDGLFKISSIFFSSSFSVVPLVLAAGAAGALELMSELVVSSGSSPSSIRICASLRSLKYFISRSYCRTVRERFAANRLIIFCIASGCFSWDNG
uniref:Putative secreted peptide n=1 Tax=Anopheles braziliensis TaxID=58242 RepID=A0A2M3ZVK2_9DIPT